MESLILSALLGEAATNNRFLLISNYINLLIVIAIWEFFNRKNYHIRFSFFEWIFIVKPAFIIWEAVLIATIIIDEFRSKTMAVRISSPSHGSPAGYCSER